MIERSANEMRTNSSVSTKDSTHLQILECSEGPVLHLLHSYVVEPKRRHYLLNGLWEKGEHMVLGSKELKFGILSLRSSLGWVPYCFNNTYSLTQDMVFQESTACVLLTKNIFSQYYNQENWRLRFISLEKWMLARTLHLAFPVQFVFWDRASKSHLWHHVLIEGERRSPPSLRTRRGSGAIALLPEHPGICQPRTRSPLSPRESNPPHTHTHLDSGNQFQI